MSTVTLMMGVSQCQMAPVAAAVPRKSPRVQRKRRKVHMEIFQVKANMKAITLLVSSSIDLIFSANFLWMSFLSGDRGRWWLWDRPSGLLWSVPTGRRDHFVWHLPPSLSHGLSGPWHGESTWGQVELPTLCEYHNLTSLYSAEKAIRSYVREDRAWIMSMKHWDKNYTCL